MASTPQHRPLQFWLASINLPQYTQTFIDAGLVTRVQCAGVNDELLDQIGISLPGHRKRILTHLPGTSGGIWHDQDSTINTMDQDSTENDAEYSACAAAIGSPQPVLPPKKKSLRDSYLFQDILPSQLGIPDVIVPEGSKSDTASAAVNDSNYVNISPAGGSTPTGGSRSSSPKPSPRPVPRPRLKSQTKAKTPTSEEKKPVPAKRPTPAPRRSPSPMIIKSPSEQFETKVDSNQSPGTPVLSATYRENSSNIGRNVLGVSIKLPDACEGETSDSTDINDLYSVPIKNRTTTSDTENKGSDKNCQNTENIQNVKTESTPSRATEDDHENAEAEDIYQNTAFESPIVRPKQKKELSDNYVNIDKSMFSQSKNTDENVVSRKATSSSPRPTRDEEYINVQYNPDSKTFDMPAYNPDSETIRNSFDQETYSLYNMAKDESQQQRVDVSEIPKACNDANDTNVDENSELYEAIWVPKKDNPALTNTDYRASSLMQFSPSNNKTDPFQSSRVSTFLAGNRISTSFDMAPPRFPPPPLPASSTNVVNDLSDLSDFDPLNQSTTDQKLLSEMPPVPPRNTNARSFKPYENVPFPLSAESKTLPGDQNMEPDIPDQYMAKPIRHQDRSVPSDPFKDVDPFAPFQPDDADFDTSGFDQNSFQATKPSPEIKIKKDMSDDIYEIADTFEEDFDPFGLKEKKDTFLPRSMSTGSSTSGGSIRLDEVPPPPQWYTTIKDAGMSSMYSLAANTQDDAISSDGSIDDLLADPDDSVEEPPGAMGPVNVEILPTTSLSPRRRERSGYLYKQGGVRNNKGWKKRWVIFDSKSLRYYSNAKDQVSKRIVPLSCMKNVEMDVKASSTRRLSRKNSDLANNSRQFKFKLHCTNRVFLFATDSLDDCKMWSSTLMEAILTYTKPAGGEVPGGDMANPDIADWIKIGKNRYKFYVALKKHKFCYYQNNDDYNMASPLHEIDMKLSAVKEIDRTRLQLSTHYSHFQIHFESSSDASNWKMAIEEAITDALGDNSILNQVKEYSPNTQCADCGCKEAHWASMNLGIILCLKCAGIHRGFDHRLSKVRSLRMDTKVWNSSLIEMFKTIGNDNANHFWLMLLPPGLDLAEGASSEDRKQHIHTKYKDKTYCDKHPLAVDQKQLNEALLTAARTDNVLLTMQILMSGADVLYVNASEPEMTAFEIAKEAKQRIQMEFLLQNGGDKTQNFMSGSEEASLVAKLRAEVQMQGYLHKTGSDMKAFLKRWCVLEHGHLSYFVNEESKVEKDRIDNDSILFVQATTHDKNAICFEISSRKANRVYLFSAVEHAERLRWMRAIAQVFCPVNHMELIGQKNFSLAGYAEVKTGFNMEWQRTWVVLENRRLFYTDKSQQERMEECIDLRKVTSISKITHTISESSCQTCLEQGPQLVLSAPDMALYFQADLARDTERMFTALESAVKKGGDILEDQVLNTDDVPVIIAQCVHFIQQHGMRMKGIYREAAQDSKVQNLLDRYRGDARSVVLRQEEHTVHEVCNVLKRFLRNLSDPLFSQELYRRWVHTAGEIDHNTKLQWYKYLLQQLPRNSYLTLRCLANHLHKLSEHSTENMMTLDNISIAFGSSLMKSNKQTEGGIENQAAIGNNMQLEMKVISDIVTYYDWLFDVKEDKVKQDLVDEQIEKASLKLQQLNKYPRRSEVPQDEMIIWVHINDPTGSAESVKINKDTTVFSVITQLTTKLKKSETGWCLSEMIKTEIERPLEGNVKVLSLVYEWQNWSDEYRAAACLCLKSTTLKDKIERAYDPCKTLFAEMKYCDKKKAVKMTFEFTQAKLSYYKDSKSMSNPSGRWNIEDLNVYKGCDTKKQQPTKYAFTFLSKGDKCGEKDLPYFGRAVYCTSENDLYLWLAAMTMAQHSSKS